MAYYCIVMPVYASTTVYVRADSKEEALREAGDYEGMGLSVCHQCSHDVSDPTIGDASAVTIDDVEEESDERVAAEWIEANS